jgi:hypothetical protein
MIDIKHDLFKNFLSQQKLGQKNVHANIDQSMVASPEQKSLGDLQNESQESKEQKKKNNLIENKKLTKIILEEISSKKNHLIERDPMKLLKVL